MFSFIIKPFCHGTFQLIILLNTKISDFVSSKIQIKSNISVFILIKMSRRFLRPLFEFWEPFNVDQYISKKAIPGGTKAMRYYEKGKKKDINANETFDNFFKEYYQNSASLRKEEKQFFERHYPERVGKVFNAYEALGIEKNSDLEKIKEAYRSNALKYHPKVDNSNQGQRRFNEIARAYHQLINEKKRDDNGQDVSSKSFFEDFHHRIEQFEKPDQNKQEQNKPESSNKLNIKAEQAQEAEQKLQKQAEAKSGDNKTATEKKQKDSNFLKGAELYSESSYYQFINGQRKLHVTKLYEKDGKRLKVDRIEGQLPDGSIEVTETLDDGTEVKNKKYVHGSKKHSQIGK